MYKNLPRKLIIPVCALFGLLPVSFSASAAASPERTAVNFVTAYFNSDLENVFREVHFSEKSMQDPEKSRQRLIAWTKMSKDESLESGGLDSVRAEVRQNPRLVKEGETLDMEIRVYFKNGNTEFSDLVLINCGQEWKVLF